MHIYADQRSLGEKKKEKKPTTLIMGKFVILLTLLVITAMQSFGIAASLNRE